jgi:hypothetical protein
MTVIINTIQKDMRDIISITCITALRLVQEATPMKQTTNIIVNFTAIQMRIKLVIMIIITIHTSPIEIPPSHPQMPIVITIFNSKPNSSLPTIIIRCKVIHKTFTTTINNTRQNSSIDILPRHSNRHRRFIIIIQ